MDLTGLLDITLRVSVAYLLLVVLARILGRKQISQLTFFDFVSGITFGSLAASTLVNPTLPVSMGVVALVVWAGWVLATDKLTLNSIPARKIIQAEPTMVIHNGRILEERLAEKHYNVNDLLKQLREKGVFDPDQVEVGIIETDGKVSILKKSMFQPLTTSDMGTTGQSAAGSKAVGKELIIDGKLMEDNLAQTGISRTELQQYLDGRGIKDISDVILAAVNPQGEIYLDLQKDHERGVK